MNRVNVIQDIINKIKAKTYLEIGVEYGTTFFRVKTKKKIAVDPDFKISLKRKIFDLPNRFSAKYYKMTSDEFFIKYHDALLKDKIDAAFIDGLHAYQQSYKDLENCLKYLSDNGVIIMHDCNPLCEASASPDREYAKKSTEARGKWNGDVWKTIIRLRSARKDLNIFVLDCDYGLGVIRKGKPENTLNYSAADIDNMSYKDFNKQREKLLNLKDINYFSEFLRTLKAVN